MDILLFLGMNALFLFGLAKFLEWLLNYVGRQQEKNNLKKTAEEGLPEDSAMDNDSTFSKEEIFVADSQIENCHEAIRSFMNEDAPMTKLSSASAESSYYASIHEPLLFEVFRNEQIFTFYIRWMKKEESNVLYSFSYNYENEHSLHLSGHHAFDEHFASIRTKIIREFGKLPEFAIISKHSPAKWSSVAEHIVNMYKHNIFWEGNQQTSIQNRVEGTLITSNPSKEMLKESIVPNTKEQPLENEEIRYLSDEIEALADDILAHPYYEELSAEEFHRFDTVRNDCQKMVAIYMSLENKESELEVEHIVDGLETALISLKQIRQTLSNKSHAQVKRQLSIMKQR